MEKTVQELDEQAKVTIDRFGKIDGSDLDRYHCAVVMSGIMDQSIRLCFTGLVSLESKGLIKLSSNNKQDGKE